ncbi:MAG: type II secretion system F family protein [Moraxellaceae bacterium]|nr:type II secretion system F family protein [Moraxellaceae bacterium]
MPIFAYKAMDHAGHTVRGEMDAINIVDLEMRLKRMELDFINGAPTRRHFAVGGQVPVRERIHFCFHLEQLTRAGVPLIEALADLRDSTEHPRFREIIASVVESIEGGRTLSQALAEQSRVFDGVFCALIRAGEASGNLPDVLRELTESLKRQDELTSFTKKLLIYPSIVAMVTVAAVFVAMIFVVPELSRLFRSTGQQLPLQTQILVALSDFMVAWWPAVIIGVAAAGTGLVMAIATSPRAAYRWDRSKLAAPLFGDVYRKIILSRFASLFAMMYASGISIIDTVRVAQDVVGNRAVRNALERVEQLIAEGHNVTAAFSASGLFPPLVIRMLRVGEHTGSLEQALHNVSYFYDRDVRESIGRLQAALEPLLILILGALMLWVALSVLGPIYDVITKMKI